MGLLDRLAYTTTSRVPTGWKDTLVEPPLSLETPQLPQPNRATLALPDSSIARAPKKRRYAQPLLLLLAQAYE